MYDLETSLDLISVTYIKMTYITIASASCVAVKQNVTSNPLPFRSMNSEQLDQRDD